MSYSSQCGQDRFLDTYVFKGFEGGVFIDIGAHDGLTINNTIFFEKYRGWTGVCVEPLPEVYQKLLANRPQAKALQCAISSEEGAAEFICNTGYTEMLSGLKNNYDPRHTARMESELLAMGGSSKIITVPTRRLESICDELQIKHIHYLSVDVEGAEFSVIKSINFDKIFIDIIDFENNFADTSSPIVDYLAAKGYLVIYRRDDIMMAHKDSPFAPV